MYGVLYTVWQTLESGTKVVVSVTVCHSAVNVSVNTLTHRIGNSSLELIHVGMKMNFFILLVLRSSTTSTIVLHSMSVPNTISH